MNEKINIGVKTAFTLVVFTIYSINDLRLKWVDSHRFKYINR